MTSTRSFPVRVPNIEAATLRTFLVDAKRSTYAAHARGIPTKEPHGKERSFRAGSLVYLDRYYGSYREAGEEVVWLDGLPIWSMVYTGGMVNGSDGLTAQAFSFLRKALSLVDERLPYRGPERYVEGDWTYQLHLRGHLFWFSGEEHISFNGAVVCEHRFLGGAIFPKATYLSG